MCPHTRPLLAAVLSLSAAFFCFAQSDPNPAPALSAGTDLTLDRARSLALAHSKTLANLDLSTESAKLDEKAQFYTMLPAASLSSSASVALPPASGTAVSDTRTAGISLSVNQTIWNGGKNSVLAAIDRLSTAMAREAARAAYFSVLDSVDSAYYSTLESYSALEAAEADLKTSTLSLAIAETRLENGAISMTDYLQVESDVESKKTAQSQARRDLAIYSAKLASLTGLDSAPSAAKIDFSAYGSLIARLAGYSEENTDAFISAVRSAVRSNNPTLAKAALTGEQAKKNVTLAERTYLPSFSASWSVGKEWTALDGTEDMTGKLSFTGTIPLDVWNTKVAVDKKIVAQKQASLDLEETGRTIDIDLQTAVLNCIAQARSVISSQKALEYAQKHYENEFELYKLSSASVSDLSTASALVSSNTKALISARYGFLSCLSTIRSVSACESDEAVLELIP